MNVQLAAAQSKTIDDTLSAAMAHFEEGGIVWSRSTKKDKWWPSIAFASWDAAKEAGMPMIVRPTFSSPERDLKLLKPLSKMLPTRLPLCRPRDLCYLCHNTRDCCIVPVPGFVPDGIAWLIECGRKVDVTDDEAQPRQGEVLNL